MKKELNLRKKKIKIYEKMLEILDYRKVKNRTRKCFKREKIEKWVGNDDTCLSMWRAHIDCFISYN